VSRGAALDLEAAAALGRLDVVMRYFDDGGGGTLGDAEIRTPIAGPSGDVMWNVARPPTTSGVSTVPLPDTATARETVSTTLAHRSTAVVHNRYRPGASRSNVAPLLIRSYGPDGLPAAIADEGRRC